MRLECGICNRSINTEKDEYVISKRIRESIQKKQSQSHKIIWEKTSLSDRIKLVKKKYPEAIHSNPSWIEEFAEFNYKNHDPEDVAKLLDQRYTSSVNYHYGCAIENDELYNLEEAHEIIRYRD